MDLIGLIITLIVLALAMYIIGLILDAVLPGTGLPPQTKPIVLGLILLIGIVMMFRGFYVRF